MNTYELDNESIEQEKTVIKQILTKNKYDTGMIDKPKNSKTKNIDKIQKTKWTTFSYSGKETIKIARLFKDSAINISYTTRNTKRRLLTREPYQPRKQFDDSGIYKLACPDCQMKYVGQTDRSFQIRYNEHLRDYKYNTNKSKFAQNLTERKHSFGPIEDVMSVLYKTEKGKMMNTMENYYIYKETINNNQINDKNTVKPNIIFETIVHEHTNRWQIQNRTGSRPLHTDSQH
jgi:hypothetical protein